MFYRSVFLRDISFLVDDRYGADFRGPSVEALLACFPILGSTHHNSPGR